MNTTLDTWKRCSQELPTENVVVQTKVDDEMGERNKQPLKLRKGLWWHPDGQMYVYYTPTHWRPL